MSVVSVAIDGTQGSSSKDGAAINHTVIYKVQTDDKLDGTAVAITAVDPATAVSIPDMGASHPIDSTSIVRNISASPTGDYNKIFEVTVEYSNQADSDSGGGPGPEIPNPVDRPSRVVFGATNFDEEMFVDALGSPVVNSAGERFDAFISRRNAILDITLQKNLATIDWTVFSFSLNTVNLAAFSVLGKTVQPLFALISNISIALETENEFSFWNVSLTVSLTNKEGGWVELIQDRGFHTLDGNDLKAIINDDGERVTRDVALNGSGQATSGAPAILTYVPYFSTNFTTIIGLMT